MITSRGAFNWSPSISPDGKKIVFQSDRLGYSDIWYCDSDGANCTQLTSLHGTAGGATWSPDGHHVAFEFQSQHYYDIYMVDVLGGRPRLVLTFPGSDNGLPNWSRDGRRIYFYSSHEPGPLQLLESPRPRWDTATSNEKRRYQCDGVRRRTLRLLSQDQSARHLEGAPEWWRRAACLGPTCGWSTGTLTRRLAISQTRLPAASR